MIAQDTIQTPQTETLQQPPEQLSGRKFVETFEGRLPEGLQQKLEAVGAAYDDAVDSIRHPADETIRKLSDEHAPTAAAVRKKIESEGSPDDVAHKFRATAKVHVSASDINGPLHESLGVRERWIHDKIGTKDKEYELSQNITAFAREADSWMKKPYIKEAQDQVHQIVQSAPGTSEAELQAIVRDTFSDVGEQKEADLSTALRECMSALEQKVAALDTEAPRTAKVLGRTVIGKGRQEQYELGRGKNISQMEHDLHVLNYTIADTVDRLPSAVTQQLQSDSREAQASAIQQISEAVSTAYGRFEHAYKSGQLTTSFTSAVADALKKAGLLDGLGSGVTGNDKTNYDSRVVEDVNSQIAALRAEGLSDRKIARRLMAELHPDKTDNDEEATERFKYLNSLKLGV